MADVYGSDGYDIDEYGNMVPRGTTLNSNPTMTATPGSPGGPSISTPQGGPVAVRPINTPNSSTGEPAVRSPSASRFQPPAVQTRPGLLTPNSSNGAPGYQVPTVNPMTLPVGGGLATGVGALNAFPTPTPEQMTKTLNNPPLADDPWGIKTISKLFGWNQPQTQTQPQTAPAPPSGAPTATATPPPPPINLPPFNVPPPPGNLPPFVRGPIPAAMPQHAPVQRAGQPNLGYGVPGAQPAPASDPINPLPGHYRASVGNARGATWVPGGMDNPAPQIFRGPTTTYGAPNYGKGPIGAQNYYQPGSAPMGPGDWTGTGPVAGPLAAFAGNNPQSTSSGGRGGGQFQMPASASAPARAPMIQPQGTHFGSTARKVFGNPAMWQYPNVQM